MSYYKEQIPVMIEKYKAAQMQCLDIVDKKIDVEDLTDDKLHAVLKGKRMAAEDAKWYAKEVDVLQDELEGKDEEKELKAGKSPIEGRAKK